MIKKEEYGKTAGNSKRFFDAQQKLERRFGRIGRWKMECLFFGVKDKTGTSDPLNPNSLKRAGFSAARNVLLEGIYPVKLPNQFSMIGAEYSPIEYDGKQLVNSVSGETLAACDYPLSVPAEVKNVLPTASGTVGVMIFSGCELFDRKSPCQFCIVGGTSGKQALENARVLTELEILEKAGYRFTNISINTGQQASVGDDLKSVFGMAAALKEKYPKLKIAAEVGPFSILQRPYLHRGG